MATRSDSSEQTCVVCCHSSDSWAVGKCNHPTCLLCSARLRILCEQNECPVCRLLLEKVIVMTIIRPFQSVAWKNWLYDKHGMYFENKELLHFFYHDTGNGCGLCPRLIPLRNFRKLKEHVRANHSLFFCEICVNDLKLFPLEFKMYSRSELTRHRRDGDVDDKSYKGHPLCRFCDERYLDNDVLHMHLRKNHFWCHFCENEGKQDYFVDCHALRKHFKNDHFMCEEGGCKEELFTAAFKSEIDLKAHRASAHSKGMSKAEVKKTRAVPVEFAYGHRASGVVGKGGGNDGRAAHRREREERQLAVAMVTSVRELSQDSRKSARTVTSSPPTRSKVIHHPGRPEGLPPPASVVVPPGFEVVSGSGDGRPLHDGGEAPVSSESWPVLGNQPASQPAVPPPPGMEARNYNMQATKKEYSVKVVQLLSKASETKSANNPHRMTSLRSALPTSPAPPTAPSSNNVIGSRIFEDIREALGYSVDKFKEFQLVSGWFRGGGLSVEDYSSQCQELLGSKWFTIGPELAKAMPPGNGRNRLLSHLTTTTNASGGIRKKKSKKGIKVNGESSAWVTVSGTNKKHGSGSTKSGLSEQDYPSLNAASELPKPPQINHGPWNVQVHT